MKNKVAHSIEAPGSTVCVDIFQRPDGSWGIEEYRRDPEDGRGWFMVGYLGEAVYPNQSKALAAALELVPWLSLDLLEGMKPRNNTC